jgi:hypothetical protein
VCLCVCALACVVLVVVVVAAGADKQVTPDANHGATQLRRQGPGALDSFY